MLVGCRTTDPDPTYDTTVEDIAPTTASTPPPRTDDVVMPKAQALIYLQSLAFSMDNSMIDIWELADTQSLSPLTRGVWRANGLRIGLIPAKQWESVFGMLPQTVRVQQSRVIGSDHPIPIISSHRLSMPIRIDLTIPPLSVREAWAQRGRLRLLAQVEQTSSVSSESLPINLTLTPHHFIPQPSFIPQDPLEKELQGTLFEMLALNIEIPDDHLLIIGLDRPWDVLPENDTTDPSQNPGQTPRNTETPNITAEPSSLRASPDNTVEVIPTNPPPVDSSTAPDSPNTDLDNPEDSTNDRVDEPISASQPIQVPPHLGRALLTGSYNDRPVQRLMVISVRPMSRLLTQPANSSMEQPSAADQP